MCSNVFDIISVNETICDDTISDGELNLFGYNILRNDRNRNGGGVALYIKDVFKFKRRDDLCVDNIECIRIELVIPNRCPIFM